MKCEHIFYKRSIRQKMQTSKRDLQVECIVYSMFLTQLGGSCRQNKIPQADLLVGSWQCCVVPLGDQPVLHHVYHL